MNRRFLLDHDPTEHDIETMFRWKVIYEFEVQRVVRVLAYWVENPFARSKE